MKYYARIGDSEREYRFERRSSELLAHCGDRTYRIDLSVVGDGTAFSMLVDGTSHDVIVEQVEGKVIVQYRGRRTAVEVCDERERAARQVAGARGGGMQQVVAPMPGVVIELMVAENDDVEIGQTVAVLEAMKMQNPITAEIAGRVTRVAVNEGDAVGSGALLIEVDGGD